MRLEIQAEAIGGPCMHKYLEINSVNDSFFKSLKRFYRTWLNNIFKMWL